MPLARITCPHCSVTLKPSRPVPEGKTVTCPRCRKPFTAGEEEVAEVVPAVQAADQEEDAGTYAVIKDDAEEAKPKKRKRDDDEDDEEDEEEEEEDIVQMYLKAAKSKDPRGPAQMAVVRPSNALLAVGLAGFFGWVITLIVFLIPVAFPNIEKKEEEGFRPAPAEKDKKDKDKKEAEKDPVALERLLESPLLITLFVLVLLLGLTQGALIALGAVKMQSLESYGWSMAGCILAILPLHTLPAYRFLWWVFSALTEEGAWGPPAILVLIGPAVGIMCLLTLKRPEVKAGFEYKAE